jgi:hypothetical protein
MARVALVSLALGAALAWSGSALAQQSPAPEPINGFGSERPFVVSLEHLGGVSYTRVTPDQGDSDSAIEVGTFVSHPLLTPGAVSRLGLHYFVSPNFSVGGLVSYADNDNLGTLLLGGGRLGFATPLAPTTSLWIRGGALYWQNKLEIFTFELKTSAVVAGGEVLFVFEPVEHFGILLGPMFEMGWVKQSADVLGSSQESKSKYIEAALTVGFFTDW